MPSRIEILKQQSTLLHVLKNQGQIYPLSPGIHHVDVGLKYVDGIKTDELCIRYHTFKKHTKSFLKSAVIPKMIGGFKTDVVVSNPVLNSRDGQIAAQIHGGIEVANAHLMESGTLGCLLYHGSGSQVGLTNHHVIVGAMGGKGEAIIQPFSPISASSSVIGNILDFDKHLDCAVFTLNKQRNGIMCAIEGFDQLFTETDTPVIHDHVKKSGITTEITYGEIEGISPAGRLVISAVAGHPNPGGKISDQGDSGSLWVKDNLIKGVVLGLHYGGESDTRKAFAYDINLVFKRLNINLKPF